MWKAGPVHIGYNRHELRLRNICITLKKIYVKYHISLSLPYEQWHLTFSLKRADKGVSTGNNFLLKSTMYQRKVDVDMLNAVKSVLAFQVFQMFAFSQRPSSVTYLVSF